MLRAPYHGATLLAMSSLATALGYFLLWTIAVFVVIYSVNAALRAFYWLLDGRPRKH